MKSKGFTLKITARVASGGVALRRGRGLKLWVS